MIDTLPVPTERQMRGWDPARHSQALEAAHDLARAAYVQHAGRVEWAHEKIKKLARDLIPELKADSGNQWYVTTRREDVEEIDLNHVVALTEGIEGEGILGYHLEIAVSTTMQLQGSDERLYLSYRTTARTVVDDLFDEGCSDEPTLARCAPDEVVTAIIV